MSAYWEFLAFLSFGAFLVTVACLRLSSFWPVAIASFFASWPIDRVAQLGTLSSWIHMFGIGGLALFGWAAAASQHMKTATIAWLLTAPIAISPLLWMLPWQVVIIVLVVAAAIVAAMVNRKVNLVDKAKEKIQAVKAGSTKTGNQP